MPQAKINTAEELTQKAKDLFKEERSLMRLDGWFYIKEILKNHEADYKGLDIETKAGLQIKHIARELPISLSNHAIFAGTQRDAFARSYALINPSFKVEGFSGYCDPTAVFNDIEPNDRITAKAIEDMRSYDKQSAYVKDLSAAYAKVEKDTAEVVYFVEQVTGHVIPDIRPILSQGAEALIAKLDKDITAAAADKAINLKAMKMSLEALLILAGRYADLAAEKKEKATGQRKLELERLEKALRNVPAKGAKNLFEALQAFMLSWQLMCVEQAPNPFAFSVGNADRIFEPYRAMEDTSREDTAALFKHLLCFYNVGDRSWAISQNLIVGGRDTDGKDLTCPATYALLDAYFDMNLPQPILSVKFHKNTPEALYAALGRFFFTPGCLTPSLFNDDAVFEVLKKAGVAEEDLPDYSIAGCQEPLIMGKDNGNTTNSWLNLGKLLELTLSDGVSTVTGQPIMDSEGHDAKYRLEHVRELFYKNAAAYIEKMTAAANEASLALSNLRVPFLSSLMGGLKTGYDDRDTQNQGTKYNGSGCLIHGLSVIADSFAAIDKLLAERPEDVDRLINALKNNFEGEEELHEYLLSCPKFGNNIPSVDKEAREIAQKVSAMVAGNKNYLGNPFRPDWSSPSTHLLYGYWVGATPDGRKSRDMLGYGVDPLYGDAHQGLGMRTLSAMQLPYEAFTGGYASHFGVDPKYFKAETLDGKGLQFKQHITDPLFFNEHNHRLAPFYLYVNVTTPDILRKVLDNPKKYAPNGVYIMRIHGTFVNFLDLSPAIQNDIIKRLDLESTSIA